MLVSAVSLVFIYEKEVKGIVIKELNKHLASEVRISPDDIDLTFISSFPQCAMQFKNITAMEVSSLKIKDTLLFAESLSLKFDLKDIFNKKYNITQISLNNGQCNLKVDKNGKPNYEIWKTDVPGNPSNDSVNFKLEEILLKNIAVKYKNKLKKIKTDFVINELRFRGNFSEESYEMSAEGVVNINSVLIEKTSYLKNKKLNMEIDLDVARETYSLRKAEITINEMAFDVKGGFKMADSLESLQIDYKAKNLDIETILSLLPDKHKYRIKDYKSTGEFFANGFINYNVQKPLSVKAQFGIKNASIEYIPKNTKLSHVTVAGEFFKDHSIDYLRLENFSADLNGDIVTGKFYLENFNNPRIQVEAKGDFNLNNIYSFWPIDTLEKLEGRLKFDGAVKGTIKDLKESTFSDKLTINLTVELEKLKTRFKSDPHEISIESCRITAHDRDIRVDDFKLMKGSSDINLTGEIPGMFNYLLDNKAPLVIKGTLDSKNLKMEDFIFSTGTSSAAASELNIPVNVNLLLDANIGHFNLGKFEANNIRGNFELKKQKAMVSDMKFETMEGHAVVNAYADASGEQLEVTLQTNLKDINVKKMFSQMNNFGQTTLLDKNIHGFISASIDFSGSWNKKLEPIFNSITSTADFTIQRGELIDFKPLESLARFVELQELKRIKFSTLSSKIEIKKSVIYIPQTIIKNSVLNIDFNGTHTFNNDVDYHIRLLINELLAKKRKKADDEFGPVENDPDNRRSAFILMTGNIDNLILKYDKKGLKQKVTEDIKQERQSLKLLLKEEFGAFKKDTTGSKGGSKKDQKFELEKPNNNPAKKTLEPKKKKEDDDDF
ncbi:MAG: hypothetical protein JWO32_2619 [Bacteroidetes bacterium]|nr:hypothetical protein [Bacteroidota bacterium]